jgi:hypothetical protein
MPEIEWVGRRREEVPDPGPCTPPAASIDFCEAMAAQFPVLDGALAEHRADDFGVVLAHLFMSDVARWQMDRYRAGDFPAAHALADWLDTMYPTADECSWRGCPPPPIPKAWRLACWDRT